MRIVVDGTAVGPAPSGARTRMLNLFLNYARLEERHDVILFLSRGSGLHAPLSDAGLECLEVAPPPSPPVRFVKGSRIWRHRLAQVKGDVMQAETLPPAVSTGSPTIVTIHDMRALEMEGGEWTPRGIYARRLLAPALKRASKIIAVSEHTRSVLLDRLGLAPSSVHVVRNAGAPSVNPASEEAVRSFRERVGIRGPYILALGHLEARKNVPVLVDAVRELRAREEHRGLELVLAGRDLDRLASRLRVLAGRNPSVPLTLTGVLDDEDRDAALTGAACLAIPSLVEGFGIVPLEAMAVGCPVVSSNRGALPEVLGDASLTFDPAEEGGLVHSLHAVLCGEEVREGLRTAGYRRVREFSWEASASALHDVYNLPSDR